MSGSNSLIIDVSEAREKLKKISGCFSPEQVGLMQYRVLRATGRKVKGIVSTDVTKEYYIKKNVAARDIKTPQMRKAGPKQSSCIIPIRGKRHIIGGNTFPAVGGVYGWQTLRLGKRYKIYARILANSFSVLPDSLQAGNPPFRNIGARKLNDATYRRAAGAGFPPNNYPLARVVGPATPHMPVNRSEDDIRKDIKEQMLKSVDTEFNRLLQKCR